MTIDEAVEQALREHAEWAAQAGSSAKLQQPRVMARYLDGRYVMRRPFKRKGYWSVRYFGTARLTQPHLRNGNLAFQMDYS